MPRFKRGTSKICSTKTTHCIKTYLLNFLYSKLSCTTPSPIVTFNMCHEYVYLKYFLSPIIWTDPDGGNMNVKMSAVQVLFQTFSTSVLCESKRSASCPGRLTLRGKIFIVPIGREAGQTLVLVWTPWHGDQPQPLQGSNPVHPVRNLITTDWAIPSRRANTTRSVSGSPELNGCYRRGIL